MDGFHLDGAPELARWIDEERGHRAMVCARALERLADEADRQGERHRASDWWRRRAALDPTDGRAALRLMQALAALGDRGGALQAARVYESLVRDELDAEPDAAVLALEGEIRKAPIPNADPGPPAVALLPRATADVFPQQSAIIPPTRDVNSETAAPRLRWRAAALVAVAALLVVLVARERLRAGPRIAPDQRMDALVVVGDLEGPDSVLAMAVREALRAELSGAEGIALASDLRLRELRTLTGIAPESPLRLPELLDVATRSGAHFALSGSVMPFGAGAQIVMDLLDPASGHTVRTLSERAPDGVALMAAVERLGRAMRAIISRTPVDTSVRALPAVRTGSLAALKSYALARQAGWRGRRAEAVEQGERALMHDSTFVLAHYLVGDLLWFLDQQSHAEAHLTRAFELSGSSTTRERLIIRARYEQLVLDRPDSALTFWELVRDATPSDPLAHEGRSWALRALGRHEEAAAAADTAMRLNPSATVPNTNNAIYSWLAVGDTSAALAVGRRLLPADRDPDLEARFYSALYRDDTEVALALADSASSIGSRTWRRQLAFLAREDFSLARRQLDSMRTDDRAQVVPRALLNEGWVELAHRGDRAAASGYARETLSWLRDRDLSPAAVARLSERIGDLAARGGDEATVRATQDLVRQRDRGRALRSYVMAQRTLDAALAFVRHDYARAARLAAIARHGVYFWRSLATIVKLEADAHRANGATGAADSLDQLIATHQIVDGDFETWALLRLAVRSTDKGVRITRDEAPREGDHPSGRPLFIALGVATSASSPSCRVRRTSFRRTRRGREARRCSS
jgi:tetratricopeptide (TPR) repeat protein